MELTTLRYFSTIAATGHMTRAAAKLGVTQPALSSMLRKLEEELGADLFDRTGRGVQLTEAGKLFLRHAEESLRSANEAGVAVRELMGLQRGSIRIGGGATAITYLIPKIVSRFRRDHPAIHFYVREAGSGAVAQSVLAGELDLGIVTLPLKTTGGASGGSGGDLLVTPWVSDELRLICPPRSSLGARRSFRWRDLEGESMVGFEAGSAVRDVIDREAAAAGVELNVVMELRSIECIKQMVSAGIGIGLISRFALKPGAGLSCRDGKVLRRLALIRRSDRVPSPALGKFEKALLALRES